VDKEIKIFTKGMNTDVEDRFLPTEQYRYAFACDFGRRDGSGGVITNEKGTTLVTFALPVGDNVCIGLKENVRNGSVVYAIYNSNGNHGWYEFFPETNTIEPILVNDILNFSLDRRIHSINIFDDNLTYCDDLAPKHIVMSSAKAHTNGTPASRDVFPYDNLINTGTQEQRAQFITAGAYPPLYAPILSYRTEDVVINNLRDRLFQVVYRYVYIGDSRSSFSPISKISSPTGDENALDSFSVIVNNVLDVEYNTGSTDVIAIEIAIREANTGSFYLVERVDKFDLNNNSIIPSFSDETFSWSGERKYVIADNELINNYQIPVSSKTQALSYDNHLFYGNYVQGYDNVDVDVFVDLVQTALMDQDIFGDRSALILSQFPSSVFISNDQNYIDQNFPIEFSFTNTDNGDVFYYTFNSYPAPGYSSAALINAIILDLNAFLLANGLDSWEANGGEIRQTSTPNVALDTVEVSSAFQDTTITEKHKTLKSGSRQKFGIVYYDELGRSSGVHELDTLNVPFVGNMVDGILGVNYFPVVQEARLRINHMAPLWAKNYQVVVAPSDIEYFIVSRSTNLDTTNDFNGKNTWLLSGVSLFDDQITYEGLEYEFQEGDRLRFISEAATANYGLYLGAVDVRILQVDSASKQIIIEEPSAIDLTNNIFLDIANQFEIYRPRTLGENVYREIGEVYGITNGLHSGRVNQTAITPALLVLDYGDAYINQISDLNGYARGVETVFYSKHYQSTSTDVGRFQVFDESIEQRNFYNHFIYGGRYFENTQTNRLFEFSANNDSSVNSEHGEIRYMESVGYTIKVIQDKKLNSVYLNRQIAVNPGGTDSVVLSDKFIGEIRPYEFEDWGTTHPESVVSNGRYLYFWDARNGIFIRDDANGPNSISAIGFLKGSKDLALKYPGARVFGNYDESRENVYWTFGDETLSDTVAYSEEDKVWTGYEPYYPENYMSIGMLFISFKEGGLWRHDNELIRNTFYGNIAVQKIRTVFNERWQNIKTWLTLTEHANKKWEAPTKGDISTENTDMYGVQETRILENKFQYQDRKFNSNIPRDMNTPNITAPVINGDRLQSEVLIVSLENTHTELTKLTALEVKYNVQET